MPLTLAKNAEPIAGYTLIERLGAGGFGEVWKAEAPGGLLKAVKFVYGEVADRHASQEVRALERIKQVRHPFVLSIERVEVVGGQLVIVSELADRTLLDRYEECRAGGGLPRQELLRYMQDAAEALDFIGTNFRLQHLDVKPSNLFLVGGRLKVGDFGLVREVTNRGDSSAPGLSPAYASPESFSGDVSFYSDQYALAIVYQEMLTGARPFRGRGASQLLEQHLHGRPNLVPLPAADQPVIARALSKHPKDRFPSCGELVRALQDAVDEPRDGPAAAPPAAPAAAPAGRPRLPDHGDATDLGTVALRTHTAADSDLAVVSGASRVATARVREGLPLPTLFVGIGGVAGAVLRQTRHLFDARSDGRTAGTPVAWLQLDTDRQALQEVTRPGASAPLAPEETVLMPLHGPEHYQPRLKQLVGWLGRHWVFRIPRSRCTDGIRPLGRLALVDSLDGVAERLRQSVRQVRRAERGDAPDRFRVVVVAGISGGTGGGCAADVGFLLRRVLREEGCGAVPVEAVLVAAASVHKEQRELARANAYVTLKELDHFLKAAGEDAPFDRLTLANLDEVVGDEDVQAGARLVAEYVYLRRGTAYGAGAGGPPAGHGRAHVTGFRLARFGFPRAELRRAVAREVCRRMIDGWLRGPREIDRPPAVAASYVGVETTTTLLLPPSDEAVRLFSGMELETERYFDAFLERAERVSSGADVLERCQQRAREAREARSRGAAERAVGRFFEECDDRFGRAGGDPPGGAETPFARKVLAELRHDVPEKTHRLEARVREILEHPARRVRPAEDVLSHFRRRLAQEADAAPQVLRALRERREAIRARALAAESRPRAASLIKHLQRDPGPPADELAEYARLCVQELACRCRAELLEALRAKAAQLADELARVRQALDAVRRTFEGAEPSFRAYGRAGLGLTCEVFPTESPHPAEFRDALAAAFASERRLAELESRFQDEVLAAHGGLRGVLLRESRSANEVFENALFPRVADAIGVWLEDRDAASLLKQRYGSNERVLAELVRCLESPPLRAPESAGRRVVVCTPDSPSGRSLGEAVGAATGPLRGATLASIPEDVVLCVELEGLGLDAAAAELVGGQPWLAALAGKLVSRLDVAWTGLPQPE